MKNGSITITFLGLKCLAEYTWSLAEAPDPHTGYPGCDATFEVEVLTHKGDEIDFSDHYEAVVELVDQAICARLGDDEPMHRNGWADG